MDFILITQVMSCTAAILLGMLLFICPYKGEGFKVYNTTRKMLMASMFLISFQYITQMIFGFRAKSEIWGTTCNLYFYVPSNVLFLLGVLNMQRVGRLKKIEIWEGVVATLLVETILTAGVLTHSDKYLNVSNTICGGIYLCIQLYLCFLVYKEYNRMVKNIDDFYGAQVEEYVHWMKNASLLLAVCFVCVPIAIFSTKATLVFGFLFWTSLAYYAFNFTYFGHFAKFVEESDEIEEAEEKKTTEGAMAFGFTNLTERSLNPLIENWIKEKKYCDSDITIVKLANEIGTNRTTLSKHINTNIGKSFREWINELRIEEAKQILRQDPLKGIEDVAISCGFSTRKYFDQVFSNHEKITAAEWRKKLL